MYIVTRQPKLCDQAICDVASQLLCCTLIWNWQVAPVPSQCSTCQLFHCCTNANWATLCAGNDWVICSGLEQSVIDFHMPVLSPVLGFDNSNCLNWMVLAHFSDYFVLESIELLILGGNNVTADPPSPLQPPHTHTHTHMHSRTHTHTHTHKHTQFWLLATVRLVLVASSFSVCNYCNRNRITFLY